MWAQGEERRPRDTGGQTAFARPKVYHRDKVVAARDGRGRKESSIPLTRLRRKATRLLALAQNVKWHYPGYCNVCGRHVMFLCFDAGDAREQLLCPMCRSNSRKRHVVQRLLLELGGGHKSLRALSSDGLSRDVYSAEARDPIWRYLRHDSRFRSSEYLENVARGAKVHGTVTCQDLEHLTYADNSLDVVITEDVFEHIRYPLRGWSEVLRVLRSGGVHIFTVPIRFDRLTLERVAPREEGPDVLLTEPEYHGDRLRGRIVAYRTFGYDMFEELNRLGFHTTLALSCLKDRAFGIVDSTVIVSRRTDGAPAEERTQRPT